jgi:hypothetical protein
LGFDHDLKVTITTGPTSLITDEARSDYEELLKLLRQDDIEGEITERLPTAAGVTWVEITELWLNTGGSAVAGWVIGKALDAVSRRAKQWLKSTRRRKLEADPDRQQRPQSVIIKNLMGEPACRIDVDPDGNMTEYRWVKIENGEQGDEESDPSPGASR